MATGDKLVTLEGLKTAFDWLNGAELTMAGATALTTTDNLNDKRTPGVYTATNGVASALNTSETGNCPASTHFRLFVGYASSSSNNFQIIIERQANKVWMRTYGSSSWSAWVSIARNTDLTSFLAGYGTNIDGNNYSTRLPDMNTAAVNRVYYLNQAMNTSGTPMAHTPTDETGNSGILFSIASHTATNQSQIQMLFMINGNIWVRSQYIGTWSDWQLIYTTIYDNEKYYLSTCVDKTKTKLGTGDKFVVIGDSISNMNWPGYVATATGATVEKGTKPGIGFVHKVDNKNVASKIDDLTTANKWTNDVKVIFVAAGVNDAGFFSGDNITYPNIKAAVTDAITQINTAIASAAPNAHIVFITPLRVGGSVTLTSRLTIIAGIIGHVALINGCSVINGFDFPIPVTDVGEYDDNGTTRYLINRQTAVDSETGVPDYIHPSNDVGQYIYARAVLNAIL